MADLRVEKLEMPAASLGPENPLPMLTSRLSATASAEVDENVPINDRKFFGYGTEAGWLPHRGQDDYDRVRTNREFVALVLENEYLKATVLPEVGGRLWSLVHKPSGRDLLFVNPVFQPANLAVRGAWVTGGVEWNACVYGHSPHTCSSLFAAEIEHTQFGDVLRVYEWDRVRCVPFQLDFLLPAASQFLFVRVRLVNPHPETIPMYWWSNITVPESPDVRVIAPADHAYTYEYWGPVHSVAVPKPGDDDITYPMNIPYGADYFFRIPDGERPWITALDKDGCGLIHTSTARQKGRKLFAWGAKPGGRRWQEFLSTPGHAYLEIQAGLTRTQLECLPMPAGAQWEWMEAFGLMEADSGKVHGDDWDAAIDEVSDQLESVLPQASLDAMLRQTASLADQAPNRILHRGSGWGALERRRREKFGEAAISSAALVFDDESLTDDQQPWLTLLHDGALPERKTVSEPGAWMVQPEWRELLEASARNNDVGDWLTFLHLGVAYFAQGNLAAAEEAWQRSVQDRPSGWAYRNLAVLRKVTNRPNEAMSYYEKAYHLLPELRPLLVEYCETLLAAGRAAEALAVIESAPDAIRQHSRVRFLEARAGLELGLPERCQPILRDDYELVDIREGESSLTELWLELQLKEWGHANGKPGESDVVGTGDADSGLPHRLDFQVVPHPHFTKRAVQVSAHIKPSLKSTGHPSDH